LGVTCETIARSVGSDLSRTAFMVRPPEEEEADPDEDPFDAFCDLFDPKKKQG
jgi:hypothetical protein